MNSNNPTPPTARIPCRYFAQGYCWRGNACYFDHTPVASTSSSSPTASSSSPPIKSATSSAIPIRAPPKDGDQSVGEKGSQTLPDGTAAEREERGGRGEEEEDETLCMICYEPPVSWGLLETCDHSFCLACIRQWRSMKDKPLAQLQASETCPTCRRVCKFVAPSSIFLKTGPEKSATIKRYREKLSRIRCRFLAQGRSLGRPFCPFGKDCLYSHVLPYGITPVFTHTHADTLREAAARESTVASELIVQALLARAATVGAGNNDLRSVYEALLGRGVFGDWNQSENDDDWDDDEEEDDESAWEDEDDGMPPLERVILDPRVYLDMPPLVPDSSDLEEEDSDPMPPLTNISSSSESEDEVATAPIRLRPPNNVLPSSDEMPPLISDSSSDDEEPMPALTRPPPRQATSRHRTAPTSCPYQSLLLLPVSSDDSNDNNLPFLIPDSSEDSNSPPIGDLPSVQRPAANRPVTEDSDRELPSLMFASSDEDSAGMTGSSEDGSDSQSESESESGSDDESVPS